ncbi:MAG TPA: hypothetical protein PK986_02050 [Spirochaetota bacterium]|nr:hypothetical protein [Spirochaetota bacterium]
MHSGIVIATMLEAEPFIEGLSMELTAREPFPVYTAGDIALVVSGIGKVNAALAAAHLIREKSIPLLHNAGAAGALREGISAGSIYHINEIIDWDRPRLMKGQIRKITPAMLEGFSMASLATLDRPVISRGERETVGRAAELVDMEGAGFIQACRTHKVKGCLWKIVSDTAEHQKGSEIIANMKLMVGSLFQFMEQRVLKIR